ncbi:MAG: UDP-N-acetylglucosamine--N-acetylmuramyl-(pentapeptide) pyrophosphoryl-undecaprenol N-acetylglucosamine transferase [Microbacteriaceae bacterium]|nr:UDP-N-acetylglucosamine--N-acetylmuramyl-(pentapeptide) pyrophosphoryl-undecaprenol N-acetylglucosamine transferase [Microbacteriaceae bacterium]
MTRVLLAGGGTAGHVNPLLAVAHELVRRGNCQQGEIRVLGTAQGLESRLVPAAGFELDTIARLPFPRRVDLYALAFWPRFAWAVVKVMNVLHKHKIELVAGFGGYASAPAYVAAWLMRKPCAVHEANSLAGFANRLGSRLTRFVATTFSLTQLPHARRLGMPLSRAITHPGKKVTKTSARTHFGLSAKKKTLVVTGGSQGSKRINATVEAIAADVVAIGWQILHIVGHKNSLPTSPPSGYVGIKYCDSMELALGAATMVISRAGAATVSELQVMGLPAIFVPYPVGNGEQEKNAHDSVSAGSAVLVLDKDFTPDNFRASVLPLLGDDAAIARMVASGKNLGDADAAGDFVDLMLQALDEGTPQ